MNFDTHAHLNLDYSEEEINSIINYSKNKKLFINIVGIDFSSSELAINISKKNSNYFFAIVGIHPNNASFLSKEEIDKNILDLENLINKNLDNIKGIGETGLDYFKTNDLNQRKMQMYSLEKHYELSIKYNLPLILHVRDAHEDIIIFLENKKYKKVLIHCYSDKLIFAKKYIDLKCMISISGIVTFKNAIELKKVVEEIDLDNILVETDSPYLTPSPFRGIKNSPIFIENIIEEIANIKKINLEIVSKKIFKSSIDFFNI